MNPVRPPVDSPTSKTTEALDSARNDNRYFNHRPESLSERFYRNVDATDAFDKIDRLLDAERATESFDLTGDRSVAVGYPDIYENGIANLSHQMIYKMVNERPGWYAARTYAPSERLKRALVAERRPYFTWEDRKPLDEHDVLTFTLSFEELATRMLAILDYSDVPVRAADRTDEDPLVVCGGTTPNYNPEPYAAFVDCFYVGEAEVGVPELLAAYEEAEGDDRHETLKRLAEIQGVYVPEFYDVEYEPGTGAVREMVALEPEAAGKVYKTVDEDFVDHPAHSVFVTPNVIYDEETFTLEVERGCAYSCNFCQYGHNNRSPRWMSVEQVVEFVEERAVEHCDVMKLFYEATSTDYLDRLFAEVDELEAEHGIDVRLGAFTANQLTERMVRVAAEGGQQCIIVAPEAAEGGGLREAVGKAGFYDDEEVFRHARWAAKYGVPNFGLYLLMGLPGETEEDIEDLAELIATTREHANDEGVLEIHMNPVFPKPLTPFQWAPMERPVRTVEKLNFLVELLCEHGYGVVVDCVSKAVIGAGYLGDDEQTDGTDIVVKTVSGTKMHYSQPILSRGDRRVCDVLFDAYCDGDTVEAWREAMDRHGLDDEIYFRERDTDETLPWGYIHNNVRPSQREGMWNGAKRAVASDDD